MARCIFKQPRKSPAMIAHLSRKKKLILKNLTNPIKIYLMTEIQAKRGKNLQRKKAKAVSTNLLGSRR